MSKPTEVTDAFSVTVQITFLLWVLLHKQLYSCREEKWFGKLLWGEAKIKLMKNPYIFFSSLPCIYLPSLFLQVQDICHGLNRVGGEKIASDSDVVSSP